MDLSQKEVSFTTVKTYSTLNWITPKTKYVWVVFHGIGYLSRYFLKYFDGLDPDLHYLIAPQAPSKYYLNGQYKHVGASWLTKENTAVEITNLMSYLDKVMANESLPNNIKLVVFGYSQGVSVATRWVASRKIICEHMILYAGGIPNELRPEDLLHLELNTRVKFIVGNRDEYLTPERWEEEKKKIELLFQGKACVEIFDGGHEINKEIINTLP